jgi:hyaluronan synthase
VRAEELALRALYSAAEEALLSARGPFTTGITNDECIAVCLVQPHVGTKEIRFATWLTSMVLADSLRVEYLWSSDSDSFVQSGAIDLTINSISDCINVGAASVALEVHNRDATLISRLCASQFRSQIYLDKACPAAIGQSTVVTGPSALFRIKALMQVIMPWYLQRILGYKTVSEFLS